MAQSLHSLAEFAVEHPKEFKRWKKQNYIVVLSCDNEDHLQFLLEKADYLGIACSFFVEPDLGYEITAATFEADPKTERLLSQLPLLK